MLAELARELPRGDLVYEPKWDGFRCLARRDGEEIDLRSRHRNPLGRYFPEIVEALATLRERSFVLDGEIVAERDDFPALMARLHPAASRVERLRAETPAVLVAFDLLAVGAETLLERPFRERRARLAQLVAAPVLLTPATEDPDAAARWLEEHEGVIAKRGDLRYEPGKRRMVKVKRDRTADCVVAGFRWHVDRPVPSSLLLGLYDDDDALQHVGIASSFARPFAEQLLEELRPRVVALEGHPWEHGFLLAGGHTGRLRGAAGRWTPDLPMDWVPVAPELVAEVAFDQVDALRFRHPARFRRWRPDREPPSCRIDQLAGGAAVRP
jgi:ATP-dependent DNA ligase